MNPTSALKDWEERYKTSSTIIQSAPQYSQVTLVSMIQEHVLSIFVTYLADLGNYAELSNAFPKVTTVGLVSFTT